MTGKFKKVSVISHGFLDILKLPTLKSPLQKLNVNASDKFKIGNIILKIIMAISSLLVLITISTIL